MFKIISIAQTVIYQVYLQEINIILIFTRTM